jgi:hypothetical protein
LGQEAKEDRQYEHTEDRMLVSKRRRRKMDEVTRFSAAAGHAARYPTLFHFVLEIRILGGRGAPVNRGRQHAARVGHTTAQALATHPGTCKKKLAA